MRSALATALLAAALLVPMPAAHAQAALDSIAPRAGSWGGEAVYGGAPGASLLYFSSPRAAWLAGLTFSVSHETADVTTLPGATATESGYTAGVDARLGRRWWSADPRARLRPLTGLGILGGLTSFQFGRTWSAGAYGELGATYFFSPHVSLGASGELAAGYGEDRFATGTVGPDRVTTRWTLRGNLARIAAGVYF
jgi:hypothetical protein